MLQKTPSDDGERPAVPAPAAESPTPAPVSPKGADLAAADMAALLKKGRSRGWLRRVAVAAVVVVLAAGGWYWWTSGRSADAIAYTTGAVTRGGLTVTVTATGTIEPTIVRQGDDRILVEAPGLGDPERLKALVGQTAQLTFHMVQGSISATQAGQTPLAPGTTRFPDSQNPGALYVVDYYRGRIEHPEWTSSDAQRDPATLHEGRERGRIYRIVHRSMDGRAPRRPPRAARGGRSARSGPRSGRRTPRGRRTAARSRRRCRTCAPATDAAPGGAARTRPV